MGWGGGTIILALHLQVKGHRVKYRLLFLGTEVTPAEFTNALIRDSVSTRPSQIRVSRAHYRRREKRCWSVDEGSARPFAPLATPGCQARAPSSTLPAESGVGEWTAEADPCT